jgi:hypothetical protein
LKMIQELRKSVKDLQILGLKPSQIDALSRHFIIIRDCTLGDWNELSKMFEWNKPVTPREIIREEPLQPPTPPEIIHPSDLPPIIEDLERKWCKGCKQLLPKSEFGKNNIEKDHLMRKCKKCYYEARYKLPSGEVLRPYVPKPANPSRNGIAIEVIREKILTMPELPAGRPETWTRGNSLTVGMISYRIGAQGGMVRRVLSQLEKEGKVKKEHLSSMVINGRSTSDTVFWKCEAGRN